MSEVTLIPVEPTPDDVQYLEDRIYEFNSNATNITDGELLGFFIREGDRIVAGICGNTWGGTCELRQFWVEESQRRRGLGTRLFQAAEREARRRGCAQIVLMTFSFQAPAFYDRHGFEVVATIEDHPYGHRNLLMRKRLASEPEQVSIRPARSDEQTILEALQRRASLSNPGDRDALLANPDAIALPIEQIAEGCVFVAERDGVVAGFAAVLPRPDGGAELDALFVEPHLWKRGIGRRLVDHIADVARSRAASFLHVVGNPHAEGFYTSCGFRVTGTVDTRFGAGLAMRRLL
jgi:GNAT superfamily N-acetyltransferase